MAIDTGSPRYMPFFFLLTVLARIFSLTPIQALGIGGVLTMILFLYGVWLFLSLYFRNDWAPFVGLIVLLGGWGAGWYWSNCYQLRCLFYVITFPSSFVFSVSFFSFWLATKILRQRAITLGSLILLGIMSALMLLCHPLTGAFAIGSLCLLALSEPNSFFFTPLDAYCRRIDRGFGRGTVAFLFSVACHFWNEWRRSSVLGESRQCC